MNHHSIREKSYRDWLKRIDANAKERRLLSDEQRKAFRKDYSAGMPRKELIEKYGLKDLTQLYGQVRGMHLSRKYGYWTPERLALLRKGYERGFTDKDMETWFIGRTEKAIAAARRRAGIKHKTWSEQTLLELERLKLQGLTDREIAKQLGTTYNAVQSARLQRLYLTINEVKELRETNE